MRNAVVVCVVCLTLVIVGLSLRGCFQVEDSTLEIIAQGQSHHNDDSGDDDDDDDDEDSDDDTDDESEGGDG